MFKIRLAIAITSLILSIICLLACDKNTEFDRDVLIHDTLPSWDSLNSPAIDLTYDGDVETSPGIEVADWNTIVIN